MTYIYLGVVHNKTWTDKDGKIQPTQGYKVTLRYENRSMQFSYYQGMGISHEPQLADVVMSICSDAQAGELSFAEFCDEFGYDSNSRLHEQIHKSCKKMSDKANRVFGETLISVLSRLEH